MTGWVKRDEPHRLRGRKRQQQRNRLFARQPLCVHCSSNGVIRVATQRDHIIPLSQGGIEHESNTQGLCDECHSIKSAQESHVRPLSKEARERRLPTGLKPSSIPLTIVCGPPGSGKSTYVREHAGPKDLVIDLDRIMAAMSGLPEHRTHQAQALLPKALDERNRQLRSLAADTEHDRAWFIVACPNPAERALWAKMLGGQLVTLSVSIDECISRIRLDPARTEQHDRMCAAVKEWWRINSAPTVPTKVRIGIDGWPV